MGKPGYKANVVRHIIINPYNKQEVYVFQRNANNPLQNQQNANLPRLDPSQQNANLPCLDPYQQNANLPCLNLSQQSTNVDQRVETTTDVNFANNESNEQLNGTVESDSVNLTDDGSSIEFDDFFYEMF